MKTRLISQNNKLKDKKALRRFPHFKYTLGALSPGIKVELWKAIPDYNKK
ncbi:MAG: hypothetical protein V4456_09530 [Bacteroidota bacterium]